MDHKKFIFGGELHITLPPGELFLRKRAKMIIEINSYDAIGKSWMRYEVLVYQKKCMLEELGDEKMPPDDWMMFQGDKDNIPLVGEKGVAVTYNQMKGFQYCIPIDNCKINDCEIDFDKYRKLMTMGDVCIEPKHVENVYHTVELIRWYLNGLIEFFYEQEEFGLKKGWIKFEE